jgi:hypothetical protein
MNASSTIDTTTAAQDRALYGCPPWCTFDHAGPVYMEPGDHRRRLADLGDEHGDSVALYVGPEQPMHVTVFLGGDGCEEYPATRETIEHLRDLALMLKQASDGLSGLLVSGELEAVR